MSGVDTRFCRETGCCLHTPQAIQLERVELSSGWSLGRGPVVDISVDSSGVVQFCGYEYTSRLGSFSNVEQDSLFQRISQIVQYSPLDALLDAGSAIDDHEVALVIWYDGKRRTFEGTRSEMAGLYLVVEELLAAAEQVKLSPDSTKCNFESRQLLQISKEGI